MPSFGQQQESVLFGWLCLPCCTMSVKRGGNTMNKNSGFLSLVGFLPNSILKLYDVEERDVVVVVERRERRGNPSKEP